MNRSDFKSVVSLRSAKSTPGRVIRNVIGPVYGSNSNLFSRLNIHLLDDVTPYDETFLPIFLLGCVIAAVASFSAGLMSGRVWPGVLLVVGILAFWSAVFIGSDMGYRVWQSMPDPPRAAFSDASVVGALVFG